MSKANTKAIYITWRPKDALDGMAQLKPWEELAYRRILDFIYVTGNRLVDDDESLSWLTKTGNRWKSIKKVLLAGDEPKIYIKDGFIRNRKCDENLVIIENLIDKKSAAGKKSAKIRKALKEKETGSTPVATPVEKNTPKHPTDWQLTTKPTKPIKEKDKKENGNEDENEAGATKDLLDIPGFLNRRDYFEEFWDAYPRREGKARAKAAWEGVIERGHNPASLIIAAEHYADATSDRENKFILMPANWLTGEGWLDDDSPPPMSAEETEAEMREVARNQERVLRSHVRAVVERAMKYGFDMASALKRLAAEESADIEAVKAIAVEMQAEGVPPAELAEGVG